MEQAEYDEILRNLVRIAAHQDIINEKQDLTNQRLALALERIELTLQAIKDILRRGNGRPQQRGPEYTRPSIAPWPNTGVMSTPEAEHTEDYYLQALALAEALGMRPLQAHGYHDLGTLYAKMGWQEQAHAELFTAIEMYRAMAMAFWRSQTEAALAQVGG